MTSNYWRQALAGEQPVIKVDCPEPGYYWARFDKRFPRVPVCIELHAELGLLSCRVGYEDLYVVRDPFEVWTWCADKPLSKSAYDLFARSHRFPKPADPLTVIAAAAEHLIETSDDGGELETLAVELEAARKAETAYHLEAKRCVDVKFKFLIERIDTAQKRLKAAREA